jgi:glycerol-3-phosphate dehydrogenase (NAD(P)+)
MARQLSESRENQKYLPGVYLSVSIEVSSDLPLVLKDAEVVILAVPSQCIREVARLTRSFIHPRCYLVNAAKGLENNTCLRLSQVLCEELPEFTGRLTVLSGPSHAEEVSRGIPTAVVVAAQDQKAAEYIQDVFMASSFRVYTNSDLVGVELGGALKNIIALGAGIAEGLGFGDNTKAALITRGLTEIARLGVALGANPLTFLGLTGVGDLVVTATSMHSRNRRAGILLGQGFALQEALQKVGMVVEGITTTSAACKLASRCGIEMPITEQTYQVLFAGLPPQVAVSNLMLRSKRHEVEEVFSNRIGWTI